MDFLGERYYKLNRILLVCVGLWPYDTSPLKKIQIIFFEALFLSILLCQLNVFLVENCDIAKIMKILMFFLINCIVIIEYNSGLLLTNTIKYIFTRVHYDWTILKNQAELDIIQKYACNARFHTIAFMLLGTFMCAGLFILSSIPFILNAIIPLNESRPLWLPIIVEYFVDQERYFFAILTHIFMTTFAGCITLAGIATMHIAYALHNCAIFEIVSYRMEHIFEENILQMSKDIREHILHERLIHVVYLHRRAIEYNTKWYAAPLWLQKVILFIMQRSSIRSTLTAASLFDASLEGFATLMSMSMSYVMFMLSTRSQQENMQKNYNYDLVEFDL
ncbi:uncharacterized protein LOC105279200 isoform X3 [Ooceraea biroi]|uniref:uncharacterized protein LOC105279200 isoform X3 n=1 Tax=Ooceraea biroi TaxID=2015173 RepID=UPI0005B97E8F|nr:uncharacterized protein LOC105279200 isoform X3 [Ooceraea biroi]